MKQAMEAMEVERAAMVAEVEAQIEQALASMAVGMNVDEYDSDGYDSGTASATASRPSSRRPSDAGSHGGGVGGGNRIKQLRSFNTETTLAEYEGEGEQDGEEIGRKKTDLQRNSAVIEEGDESEEAGSGGLSAERDEGMSAKKMKRFSSSMATTEAQQDGMKAVDEGISERSDRIARKVLEIQQKLENALAADHRERERERAANRSSTESGSEMSEARYTPRRRAQKGAAAAARIGGKGHKGSRNRSAGGNSSSGHVRRGSSNSRRSDSTEVVTTPTKKTETTPRNSASGVRPTVITTSASEAPTPTTVIDDTTSTDPDQHLNGDQSSIDSRGLRKISSGASLGATRPATPPAPSPSTPALTNALTGTTDDSDTDFQSAYSASPRAKYGDAMVSDDHLEDFGGLPPPKTNAVAGRFRSPSESTEDGKPQQRGDVSVSMRERVSSVATVKRSTKEEGVSPTFSDDTVHSRVPRSRGLGQ